MNGTVESRRSAISDSPTTDVATHERSAMSWWFRPDPVRISRGPALTKPSTMMISSVQKLCPSWKSRDQTRAAPRTT